MWPFCLSHLKLSQQIRIFKRHEAVSASHICLVIPTAVGTRADFSKHPECFLGTIASLSEVLSGANMLISETC